MNSIFHSEHFNDPGAIHQLPVQMQQTDSYATWHLVPHGNTTASTTILHESLNFHSICKSYPSTDFPVSSGFRTVNGLGSMPTVLGIKSLEKDGKKVKDHINHCLCRWCCVHLSPHSLCSASLAPGSIHILTQVPTSASADRAAKSPCTNSSGQCPDCGDFS